MKPMMIVFLTFFLFLSGNICAADYLTSLDGLLKQYVKSGTKEGIVSALVDYKGWSTDTRHKQTMDAIQKIDPTSLTPDEKKAFWINAYNFLTVDLMIRNPSVKSIKDLGSVLQSPWEKYEWDIHGDMLTLDKIEHKILRKMSDPRIHMAIVCASLSCPDLRAEAYRADKINSQLDNQAQRFLANPSKGLKKSAAGLTLSPIFKWFEDDFGGEQGVLIFVSRFAQGVTVDNSINDNFAYNWNLNQP